MRVGLNLLYLIPGEVGGTEVYARELIESLAQLAGSIDLLAFVARESEDWPLPQGIKRVVCPVSARKRWRRYLYEQIALPVKLHREQVDLVHSLGYVAPIVLGMPSIVTVHDLVFKYAGMPRSRRMALRFFVTMSILRAATVVTDSRASKEQILSYVGKPEDKIVVVHLGGDHRLREWRPEPPLRSAPYFLAFSSRSPSKNIGALLTAFREASTQEGFEHRLVIVGYVRPADAQMAASISRVDLTGLITDQDVCRLLAEADFLVVPSTYEGFGLPVAEAMWMGVPSLLANRASLPEIGGDAALLFDPTDATELAKLLTAVSSNRDLRKELARRALARAPLFSWHTAAATMLRLYQDVSRDRRCDTGT